MVRVTVDAVYAKLHHTTWKDAFQIAAEIASDRDMKSESIGFWRITPKLRELEADGLAEHRENYDDAERVAQRGGRPVFEYRLTEAGLRKRVEQPKSNGLEGILVPKTT